MTADPYDHPGFAPVPDELNGVPLRIEGELPVELDGLFLRNGPNARFPARRRHMFDGEAMLHAVELRGGMARYSSAVLRTPRTRAIEKLGRNPFLGVADLTGGDSGALRRLLVERLKTRLGLLPRLAPIEAVSSSTSVLHHERRLFCLQETGLPFGLDVARDGDGWLRIDGGGRLEDFGGGLRSPFSAHPKVDPATGEVHAICQDIMTGTTRHVVLLPGGGVRSAVVDTAKPPAFFIHDFVLTETHLIFPDSSLRFDPRRLAKPPHSVAAFDTARRLRFGMIARDHRDDDPVRWFETPAPGHIWHIANGWEEDGAVLIHAPVFRDYPATIPIHTPAEPHAVFARWRLDLATGAVDETTLLEDFYERPGIDPRRYGRRSRYAWLLDESRGGVMGKGVLKYDLIEGRAAGYVDYGALHGGEPVLVPRGDAEDDAWLLDLLADGATAVLLVVDAATMTERCRIHLPRRVPFGVHGLWLTRAETDDLLTASTGASMTDTNLRRAA